MQAKSVVTKSAEKDFEDKPIKAEVKKNGSGATTGKTFMKDSSENIPEVSKIESLDEQNSSSSNSSKFNNESTNKNKGGIEKVPIEKGRESKLVSFRFPEKTLDQLEYITEITDAVTKTRALVDAVSLAVEIYSAIADGGKVYVRDKEGLTEYKIIGGPSPSRPDRNTS